MDQAQQLRQHREDQASGKAKRVQETLEQFLPPIEQVIMQTRRRVLAGDAVPAGEQLVSIVEPETAIMRNGKRGHAVEFGHGVWLGDGEGGIVSQFAVLAGNPVAAEQGAARLDPHVKQFGGLPQRVAGDRKVWSRGAERAAAQRGVKRVVVPQFGPRSHARRANEEQRWFVRGRRWRTGIAGRIRVLKRRQKLARCL